MRWLKRKISDAWRWLTVPRLYWVVTEGDWHDPMSWSKKRGGIGGDGVPDHETDAFVGPIAKGPFRV